MGAATAGPQSITVHESASAESDRQQVVRFDRGGSIRQQCEHSRCVASDRQLGSDVHHDVWPSAGHAAVRERRPSARSRSERTRHDRSSEPDRRPQREIVEAALAGPPLGAIPSPVANVSGGLFNNAMARTPVASPLPGVIPVQLQDVNLSGTLAFPERPAIYQMFIQVERIP